MEFVEFIKAIAWPSTVCFLVWYLKNDIVNFFNERDVTVQQKGLKIVLSKLKKEVSLNPIQRRELKNLTAHDIWALDHFSKSSTDITSATVAQKVAAVSLNEIGLIDIHGTRIIVTSLGQQLLRDANDIIGLLIDVGNKK